MAVTSALTAGQALGLGYTQAGLGLVSPFVQGAFGLIGQNQAYKQNKALMWDQAVYNNILSALQWEREMQASNTAYRRAVKDLKGAGLNPILAVHGMSGASTPNIGAPSVSGHSAISAGSISPLSFDVLGALEASSRIEANTALKAKYDAEAELTKARVPLERSKGILGTEAEGGFNTIKKISSELGKKAGSVVGDWIFNRNKHSATPIMNQGEALRRLERLEKEYIGIYLKDKNDPDGVYSKQYILPRKK